MMWVENENKKLQAIYFLSRKTLHLGDVCQKGGTSLFECTSCGIFKKNASKTHDVSGKIKKIHIGYPFSNKTRPQVGWYLPEKT